MTANRIAPRKHRGVTLIMVAAVLAILAALSTGFYTLTIMQTRSATRFADSVRAEMMARAGIEDAIARLRELAYQKTEDPSDPWYMVNYLDGARKGISFPATDPMDPTVKLSYTQAMGSAVGEGSDRFILNVYDSASRININACDNLGVVLDNLCRVIGPPLVPADANMLQPGRWAAEGAPATYATNPDDQLANLGSTKFYDVYYQLDPTDNRPLTVTRNTLGPALYGDGYAIAGYRARNGRFKNLSDVKNALTYVKRSSGNKNIDEQLEDFEREVKFAAIRDYITIDSWVDTNTVCVGKFEWIYNDTGASKTIAFDRDKSWVSSVDSKNAPIIDPQNTRGSLRGCYLSIMNGHGAGQLRRIVQNGVDWIEVENGFTVPPGPTSSYMIIAKEDALLDTLTGVTPKTQVPRMNSDGTVVDDPDIDYSLRPLCIHRAPININTASDKVLAALFMGINIQHGHPLSIGTDVDPAKIRPNPLKAFAAWNATDPDWKIEDRHGLEAWVLTAKGLKRTPFDSGKLVFDRPIPNPAPQFAYLNNFGMLDPAGSANVNEAQELAYRIIVARQLMPGDTLIYIDPATGNPTATNTGLRRKPFASWDDFYFRIVKPWDDQRFKDGWIDKNGNGLMDGYDEFHKSYRARLIMSNFNSNTDILKFNPNIEWIDRWGRNFTEMEPVMVYTNTPEPHNIATQPAVPVTDASIPFYLSGEQYLKEFGKPNSGAYLVRSFRYKSDELIDKTDLNRSTSEFSFDSGGIYEIQCLGHVVKAGNVIAERRMEALVKVYDVWRESTQRQFTQGVIEAPAGMGARGSIGSGQVSRDANPANSGDRLPLVTLPEPLVPLNFKLNNPSGLADVVDTSATTGRDAWGRAKGAGVPDIVANLVLPANYDGQICLATNTSKFDRNNDKDTFLASFNGDLDAEDSVYNGREQAKTPTNVNVRVVDTFSLLGLLNDAFIDQDPDLPLGAGGVPQKVYKFATVDSALRGLDPAYYWNNVTLRMGDLRTDGVYLSGPGVSGNDATLKYLFGPNKENLDSASKDGNLVSMWMKPNWRHNDNRTHELFNGCNPGGWWDSRQLFLKKGGRFAWSVGDDWSGSGLSGTRARNNDLMFAFEGVSSAGGGVDRDVIGQLHGGTNRVDVTRSPNEYSAYHVQPFRWSFVGARWNYHYNDVTYRLPDTAGGSRGLWVSAQGGLEVTNQFLLKNYVRPFVDSQRDHEGQTTWKPDLFLTRNAIYQGYLDRPTDLANSGPMNSGGTTGQDVKYSWADPKGVTNNNKCFGINNLNFDSNIMIYRNLPEDGTYAVIDELKISNKDAVMNQAPDWSSDRITRPNDGEMTLSRYYMPDTPGNRGQCPIFTSQTLLQSLRGFDKKSSLDQVTLVRVNWTCFTPRFMHEYKAPGTFSRQEIHTYDKVAPKTEITKYKGPFDYIRYNDDDDTSPYNVNRPMPPELPLQSHATKGIEVEVLDDKGPLSGFENSSGSFVAAATFVNPDVINSFRNPTAPTQELKVSPAKLRYRVRFRYPIDKDVDPTGGQWVDPAKHYMLDTPVFDDISITYFTKPRILSYKDVSE